VKTKHTNKNVAGQVYVPELNYLVMILCLIVCLVFKHSANLTYAYGVAVSGDMFIENILFISVMRIRWKVYWPWIILYGSVFLFIDANFLTANLVKVPSGGWLPVTIGIVMATMMVIWYNGRSALVQAQLLNRISVDQLLELVESGRITKSNFGVGVFMSSVADYVPPVLTKLISHIHTLPQTTILLTIKFVNVPFVDDKERLLTRHVGYGIHQVVAIFGYVEHGNVKSIVRKLLGELQMPPPVYVSQPPTPTITPPLSRDLTPPGTPRRSPSVDFRGKDRDSDESESLSGSTARLSIPLVRRFPRGGSHNSLPGLEHEAGVEERDEPFKVGELVGPETPPSLFDPVEESAVHLHHHQHHQHHAHDMTQTVTTFYLARERIVANKNKWFGHRLWVYIFDITLRNTRSAASVFRVPAEGCVEIGTTVVL